MKNNSGITVIDSITRFVMRQSSRRGFMKRVGEAAVILTSAFGVQIGLSGFSLAPLSPLSCPPGCKGICSCSQPSSCISGGRSCSCPVGNCAKGIYVQANLYFVDADGDCLPQCECLEGCPCA